MEAACESARHAVNAVLDHYIWVETGGADLRESTLLDWRFPFGFLDQGYSTPIRQPTPAGDYCFVFDIENREPLETRSLRNLDSQYCRADLPHPLDTVAPTASDGTVPAPHPGGPPMTSPTDYTGQLLASLQAWRQYLEQAVDAAQPTQPVPAAPPAAAWPLGPMPPVAPAWPSPPGTAAPSAMFPPSPLAYLPAPTPVPAPPGPPTPPVAPPPGLVTGPPVPVAPPAAAPPAPEPFGPVAPMPAPAAETGVPAPAAPASLFGGTLAAVPPEAVTDRQPGSAFRWTAQDTAGPAAVAAPAASLFSSPAPVSAPVDDGPPAPVVRPLMTELVGPAVTATAGPPAAPAEPAGVQQLPDEETVRPRFLDVAAYQARPPFFDRDRFGQLGLSDRLSPRPVRLPTANPTEIVGRDPRA